MSFNGSTLIPAEDLCCLLRRARSAIKEGKCESLTSDEVKTIEQLWSEHYPEVPFQGNGIVMVAYGDTGHAVQVIEIPVQQATVSIFTKLFGPDCIWS